MPIYSDQLRPLDLSLANWQSEFTPLARLQWNGDGQPLHLRVLLCAKLDPATERSWALAGLLKDEHYVENAFLRHVTITHPEEMDYLNDWHVEGIAKADSQNFASINGHMARH